jgi:hypothetical protein
MRLVLDLWIRCPSSSFQLGLLAELFLLLGSPAPPCSLQFWSSCSSWLAPPSPESTSLSLLIQTLCFTTWSCWLWGFGLGFCGGVLRFLAVYAQVSGMVLCWCEICLWWACLSTTAVLTAHSCMLWVCCLQVYSTPCACGQIEFLFPPEQAMAGVMHITVLTLFCVLPSVLSHMANSHNRNDPSLIDGVLNHLSWLVLRMVINS